MIDEVFNLMKYFPNSFINCHGEVILSVKGNVDFTAKNCHSKEDIICKLLEWVSRPLAKGRAYSQEKRNNTWRDNLILHLNEYLGTDFTQDDMYWIYDKLGNGVNHELTLEFIKSGFDLSLVYPKRDSKFNLICLRCRKSTISISPKLYGYLGYTRCSYCEECLSEGIRALKERDK